MKTLLIFSLFIYSNTYSQMKIGNIVLDSNTASRYLTDCYIHPDTVKPKGEFDFLSCTGCSLPREEFQRAKIMAEDFRSNLEKNSIGQVIDTVHYKAFSDTTYDGILMADWNFKKGARKIKVTHHEAGSYTNWKGYLIPRKPSEEDFIKWYNKTK